MEKHSHTPEPVRVFLRLRPETVEHNRGANDHHGDDLDGKHCLSNVDGKTVKITPPDGFTAAKRKTVAAVDDRLYTFDKVFPPESSQEELYKHISGHVNATVRGYNTTVFAYGSTGSGKTFCMSGNSAAPGIIPRAISEIFSIIEATAAREKDVFFYVRLSYVELYNNNFRNLLDYASKELAVKENEAVTVEGNATNENTPNKNIHKHHSPSQIHPGLYQKSDKIEVRESKSAGIFLAGSHLRIPVTTAQEAFQLINRGNKNRATGMTNCNDYSSRSHAILTLHVESRVAAGMKLGAVLKGASASTSSSISSSLDESPIQGACTPELRLGKMHLVDLAGSERLALSGAEGDTLLETQSINLSLTAIGDVLSALSKNAAIEHQRNQPGYKGVAHSLVPVPYRNSKLTHLLKDSLGGNSKTIMIATCRTHVDYFQQTQISLMYAARAKKVRNRSLVNRDVIGDTGIHAVSTEIERLKSRLEARSMEFTRLKTNQLQDAQENLILKARLQDLNYTNDMEKKELEKQMSNVIHSQAGQLSEHKDRISNLQGALQSELSQ